jgi:hypothetical protein
METLTTIEAPEIERRERAWRYERLLDAQLRAQQAVDPLRQSAPSTKALEQILALVDDVPEGLVSRPTRFLPGGFALKQLLRETTAGALADLQRKSHAAQTALVKAEQKLAEVNHSIKEFESCQ